MFELFGIKPGAPSVPPPPPPPPEPVAVVVTVPESEPKPVIDLGAQLYGKDLFGESMAPTISGILAKRFGVPPFSVLNAREGYWQERKRAWIGLGDLYGSGHITNIHHYDGQAVTEKSKNFGVGYDNTRDGVLGINSAARSMAKYNGKDTNMKLDASTSVFDPVLCELVFKWFCPSGGHILDPFGGESTKGIVATVLGLNYTAIEVRQEQVDANYAQAAVVGVKPNWICGDSAQAEKILPADLKADLIFTSPPYFDLEVYSDDEADGSAFSDYRKFMVWYKDIFGQCVAKLRQNRFLVVKVGEIRDKDTGAYRNFVGDNITCFKELGLHYYNEIILITSAGSLPIRAGKQFSAGRKVGKTHQNVLCFYKGDIKRIKDEFGDVDCSS